MWASGLPGTSSLANVDVGWPLLAPDHHKLHGVEGPDGLSHGRVAELGEDTRRARVLRATCSAS